MPKGGEPPAVAPEAPAPDPGPCLEACPVPSGSGTLDSRRLLHILPPPSRRRSHGPPVPKPSVASRRRLHLPRLPDHAGARLRAGERRSRERPTLRAGGRSLRCVARREDGVREDPRRVRRARARPGSGLGPGLRLRAPRDAGRGHSLDDVLGVLDLEAVHVDRGDAAARRGQRGSGRPGLRPPPVVRPRADVSRRPRRERGGDPHPLLGASRASPRTPTGRVRITPSRRGTRSSRDSRDR